jgi:hypothetical protein
MTLLIVTRENGLFTLREVREKARGWFATVRSNTAQGIIDYLRDNWPVGTRAQWIILR